MSFNTQHCMNFLTGKIDFEIMADAIKKYDPDIVGLQEMRDKGRESDYEAQVEILSRLCNMPYRYFAKAIDFGGVNPYGNGFLSKIPIESAETILIPDPDPKGYVGYYETRCVLKARLEGGITVLVTHFGLNPDEQKNAAETVLGTVSSEKCILMGDFNVRPNNALLNPIREILNDTAVAFESEKFSFPSNNPTRKIDYIFVSKDIEILSADIPECIASDHRPHLASIGVGE